MKSWKQKWLALVLAMTLILGSVGIGTGFAVGDPYSDLFDTIYTEYLAKMTSAEVNDVSAALLIIFDNEDALKKALKDSDTQGYLAKYGFNDAVYSDLFQWLKENAFEVRDMLVDVVGDDDLSEKATYVLKMKEFASELWDLMPVEFKTRVNNFAPNSTERLAIMEAFVTDFVKASKFGLATENSSGDYSLDLNTTSISDDTLKGFITDQTDVDGTNSHATAARASMVAILDILDSEDLFNTDQDIIAMLLKYGFVNEKAYVPSSGGGSTGGGGGVGGGGIIAPPADQPIPTPEKPVGTPNPDATYTSLAMREALQLINSAVVTQTQVDAVLEDLEKEVLAASQDIVETLQVVERAEALVAKLLENSSLTDQGAINYANQIMTQFIAPALEKDAVGGTHHELEALAASMIESVLERIGSMDAAAVITDAMVKAAVSEQNNALVMMEEGLSAIFTDAEIAALSQNVSVELDGTSVKLDPAAVAYMKSNDIGIKVMTDNVAMTLPAAMMDTLRAGLSLVVELESKAGSGLGNKLANGAQGTVGAAFDLSVYLVNDQDAVVEVLSNVQPLISLPIGNFRANLHTVGAYYLNETTGEWEYVRSSVVGDRVVFRAPHLSTYGVLQRNVVFADMTNHWAKAVIEELAVKGIVSGRTLTEYAPNGTITRAEFATILVQALRLEGDVKVTFNDVNSSDWYYKYVNVAALHGLVSGVGNGKFDPNANITRQDMAIMIMKAYEKMIGKSVKSVAVGIKDLSEVSAYAKDRVLAARFNTLIGGYPDGSFMPLANATRAEAGQMVGNLLKK